MIKTVSQRDGVKTIAVVKKTRKKRTKKVETISAVPLDVVENKG